MLRGGRGPSRGKQKGPIPIGMSPVTHGSTRIAPQNGAARLGITALNRRGFTPALGGGKQRVSPCGIAPLQLAESRPRSLTGHAVVHVRFNTFAASILHPAAPVVNTLDGEEKL